MAWLTELSLYLLRVLRSRKLFSVGTYKLCAILWGKCCFYAHFTKARKVWVKGSMITEQTQAAWLESGLSVTVGRYSYQVGPWKSLCWDHPAVLLWPSLSPNVQPSHLLIPGEDIHRFSQPSFPILKRIEGHLSGRSQFLKLNWKYPDLPLWLFPRLIKQWQR